MATSTTGDGEERGTGEYERLLARCRGMAPVPTAVAYPCDESSLDAAVEAAWLGLIAPILVGPGSKICGSGSARGPNGSGLRWTREPTRRGGPRISVPGSRVSAWVIPTDEERMIAEHTLGVWRRQQGATRPS